MCICADESETTKQTALLRGLTMREPWHYNGRNLSVANTADIPANYRVGHPGARLVQTLLDQVPEWDRGNEQQVVTLACDEVKMIVVVRSGRRPLWAKHKGHHARKVELSPFIKLSKPEMTKQFTLELVGSPSRPVLVRAYPGGYCPPLPWQISAQNAPGGYDACRAFWQTHAYVHSQGVIIPGSEAGHRAPRWFLDKR